MVDLNIGKSETTNLNSEVTGYQVSSKSLDFASGKETYFDFPKAKEYIGYYKKIPELKKAIDALAMWTAGKGFTTESKKDELRLEMIEGWGEDTSDSIFENLLIMKKVVGDSFAEIIRNDNGDLINIKPISPERMRIVVDKNGLIKRYEVRKSEEENQKFQPQQILHLCNDRVGDEIHGTSVIEACKWVIDARNEAMDTYRKILKRQLALGVLYVDTDDEAEISKVMEKYKDAIDKNEVLVLPEGTAEVRDAKVQVQDFVTWIRDLGNNFYQAVGVPKAILGGTSEYTEASSKSAIFTFDQVWMSEQRKLEQDIWSQLGIRIKFKRPPSLKDGFQEDEAKNTGQVGFQPKEAGINMERE